MQGMSLWWPSTTSELAFLKSAFPGNINTTHRQVGFRHVSEAYGILHSDYSLGLGIAGITHDLDGVIQPVVDGQSFMEEANTSCLVYDFLTDGLALQSPCALSKAVCKVEIGIIIIINGTFQTAIQKPLIN